LLQCTSFLQMVLCVHTLCKCSGIGEVYKFVMTLTEKPERMITVVPLQISGTGSFNSCVFCCHNLLVRIISHNHPASVAWYIQWGDKGWSRWPFLQAQAAEFATCTAASCYVFPAHNRNLQNSHQSRKLICFHLDSLSFWSHSFPLLPISMQILNRLMQKFANSMRLALCSQCQIF